MYFYIHQNLSLIFLVRTVNVPKRNYYDKNDNIKKPYYFNKIKLFDEEKFFIIS